MERRIIDGQTTSLWYDPWIKGGRPIEKLGASMLERVKGEEFIVKEIISDSEWRASRHSYIEQFKEEVENIKIHSDREQDY